MNRIINIEVEEKSEIEEKQEPFHAEHSKVSNVDEPNKPKGLNHSPLSLIKKKLKIMEIE